MRHADVVFYGIGRAMDVAKRRGLSVAEREALEREGAVAEALGFYFDAQGRVVGQGASLAFRPEDIGHRNRAAAVAAGGPKPRRSWRSVRIIRTGCWSRTKGPRCA